jgi:6-phosphofructokinase 1
MFKKKKQNFIGIPKTIDNDLPITDHCPGYGSAAKYIAITLREIIRDNTAYGVTNPTVSIVEIMGRHAGWLTAAAALAKDETCEGVDAIFLPELPIDIDKFVNKIEKLIKKNPTIVIAVSEGLKTTEGKFVVELNNTVSEDAFGHKQLGGCAETLCKIVNERLKVKVRPIILSTLQRASAHLQSLTDVQEAEKVGIKGAQLAYKGETGKMVIMERVSNDPYKIKYSYFDDIHEIANLEKKVPIEWIDQENDYVKKELIDYIRPLIQGEVKQITVDGIPQHLIRK